jgi:DNA polymerase III epsilon subunit-like protein
MLQNSKSRRCERDLHDRTKRFVVFDVETTGLNAWRGDRIIEVGAVTMTDGLIGEEFHSLIGIERSIPKTAWRLHGITIEMLSGQPKVEEVLPAFRQFIGRSVLVAHNADFDMGFLRWECSRMENYGKEVEKGFICYVRSNNLIKEIPFCSVDFEKAKKLIREILEIITGVIIPERQILWHTALTVATEIFVYEARWKGCCRN